MPSAAHTTSLPSAPRARCSLPALRRADPRWFDRWNYPQAKRRCSSGSRATASRSPPPRPRSSSRARSGRRRRARTAPGCGCSPRAAAGAAVVAAMAWWERGGPWLRGGRCWVWNSSATNSQLRPASPPALSTSAAAPALSPRPSPRPRPCAWRCAARPCAAGWARCRWREALERNSRNRPNPVVSLCAHNPRGCLACRMTPQ
mmetsp:Transcript_75050/g.165743  ORF Transcript_75050/g.165743 Transcript_75050/m.165743 type:complete len:203 (-) Transcript_75050:1155-1763(-)